jgi:hypothetical protein
MEIIIIDVVLMVIVIVIVLKGRIQSFEPVKLTFMISCKHLVMMVMIIIRHVGFFKQVSLHHHSLTAEEILRLLLLLNPARLRYVLI